MSVWPAGGVGVVQTGRVHPTLQQVCVSVCCAGGVGAAPVLRLQAEKKVFSRQAVSDITPADAAARLVCMSEEGQVGMQYRWLASSLSGQSSGKQCRQQAATVAVMLVSSWRGEGVYSCLTILLSFEPRQMPARIAEQQEALDAAGQLTQQTSWCATPEEGQIGCKGVGVDAGLLGTTFKQRISYKVASSAVERLERTLGRQNARRLSVVVLGCSHSFTPHSPPPLTPHSPHTHSLTQPPTAPPTHPPTHRCALCLSRPLLSFPYQPHVVQ
jgi:hypothetical protein